MAIVHAQSIGLPGRVLLSSRHHHFVVDASESRGGTAEALTAGELFLSSLIGCGSVIVEEAAIKQQLPLTKVHFDVSAERNPEDPGLFDAINFEIVTHGISQDDAQRCVDIYTQECPIFRLAQKGSKVTLNITAQA